MSQIQEFPHPGVIIHYHPTRRQFTLDDVRFALDEKLHALELDLHFSQRDRQVVCNHNRPTVQSPTLEQVIDLILTRKGDCATVNDDGRQFFLVLDPKDDSIDLFDGILEILDRYASHWSTAVSEMDPPRGITVVITGNYRDQFHAHFLPDQVNRLCIVEGHDYSREIHNLSEGQPPFQWMALRSGDERGRVNNLHDGSDALLKGRYKVRVWDCDPDDLLVCLASGIDQINCDREQVRALKRMILDQSPRGRHATLAIRGEETLLTWQGPSSNDLYVALGTVEETGLHFPRQIMLTHFLVDEPLVLAPTGALTSAGQLLIAYEVVSDQRGLINLWHKAIQYFPRRLARLLRKPQSLRYISGRFYNLERFVTFDGNEHQLVSLSGAILRGCDPALAVAPDGRVLVVYESVARRGLRYFSGILNSDGELVGQDYDLIEGEICQGYSPAIAVDNAGRVVIIYQEPGNRTLQGFSGFIDQFGQIVGRRFSLAQGNARCGYSPSVAVGRSGRLIVAYEGSLEGELCYVSGILDESGCFDAETFPLTDGGARHGKYPSVAFDRDGAVNLLYETPADHRFRYVQGALLSGRLVGEERWLSIGEATSL